MQKRRFWDDKSECDHHDAINLRIFLFFYPKVYDKLSAFQIVIFSVTAYLCHLPCLLEMCDLRL